MDKENKFEKLKKISEKLHAYDKTIMEFDRNDKEHNFVPGHRNPNEDGLYLTIRCGLSGIYTVINEWKNGMWQMEVTDDSRTIAYSRYTIDLKVDE
jgi:hypothetical protein